MPIKTAKHTLDDESIERPLPDLDTAHALKRSGKMPKIRISDPGLSGAVAAAKGEVEPDLERPPIQPPRKLSLIQEALAAAANPLPQPAPQDYGVGRRLRAPRSAFRMKPREDEGRYLYMVSLPFGESLEGENFTFPIAFSLIDQLRDECPTLTVRRFELRLIYDAGGRFSILEIPVDPASTPKGEENRQTLLRHLATTETEWMVLMKMGGNWTSTPSAQKWPLEWPKQSFDDMIGKLYEPLIVTSLDNKTLMRYRLAASQEA
jgi:hypothetical protein